MLCPAIAAVFVLLPATPARAENEALLRLLQVLRDRGSITPQEYEEIRSLAEPPRTTTGSGQAGAIVPRLTPQTKAVTIPAQEKAGAAIAPQEKVIAVVARQEDPIAASARQEDAIAAIAQQESATKAQSEADPPVAKRDPEGRWYERLGLRGYTQLRLSDVVNHEGPALEVPADRSVNENESFIIRRGRFVLSGDVTDRLSLYAQSDFNGSIGTSDFAVQMRDLYADIWLDADKRFRVRAGQSKIPFGWVNMQSSQNRAPLERPDALNSAVEGERDYGALFMWTSSTARQRFRDITARGLKGTGDYGTVAVGLYSGQGPNRADQNGQTHVVARVAYPFRLPSGQFVEVGVQAYRGRFVTPLQAIAAGTGAPITPTQNPDGEIDQRIGFTAIWYPQRFGIETEWNFGRGPELSPDFTRIQSESLHGGYVQVNYRAQHASGTWFPFTRWNYYDGARKFARNAPPTRVNELDIGVEFAKWAEVELTGVYTHTFRRTRTGTFPFTPTLNANRVGVQLQWSY